MNKEEAREESLKNIRREIVNDIIFQKDDYADIISFELDISKLLSDSEENVSVEYSVINKDNSNIITNQPIIFYIYDNYLKISSIPKNNIFRNVTIKHLKFCNILSIICEVDEKKNDDNRFFSNNLLSIEEYKYSDETIFVQILFCRSNMTPIVRFAKSKDDIRLYDIDQNDILFNSYNADIEISTEEYNIERPLSIDKLAEDMFDKLYYIE